MEYMGFVNLTPFKAGHYFLADEKGSDVLTFVVKATYTIMDQGEIELAEDQDDIIEAPQYYGEPGESSIKYDSEIYYTKKKADAVLIGHAQEPGKVNKRLDVAFRVGPIQKNLRVSGNRSWKNTLGIWSATPPQPFEKMPLCYERSFGGWDTSHPEDNHHDYEPANPVGTGFMAKKSKMNLKDQPLPNIESLDQSQSRPKQRLIPQGFGFIAPDWEPRKVYAGTFDETWQKEKMPLLPDDFDQTFYNAGSSGLISDEFFQGGEKVDVVNASHLGRLSFTLPELTPEAVIKMKDGTCHQLFMVCDTVIVNTDENKVHMLWRSHMNVYKKMHKILWAKTQMKTGEG